MELNTKAWGSSASVKPKLLTGLAVCSCCNRRLAYLPRKKETHSYALRCNFIKCGLYQKRVKATMVVEAINAALAKRSKELASLTDTEPVEVTKIRTEIDNLSNLNDPDLKEVIDRKKDKLNGLLLTESPILKERASLMAEPAFWEHAASLPDTRLREIYLEFVLKAVANPKGVTEVELRI
tara:strand:- start:15 stop:557 length:543 start_codon:yes stop_codon:yes gene_type:complete